MTLTATGLSPSALRVLFHADADGNGLLELDDDLLLGQAGSPAATVASMVFQTSLFSPAGTYRLFATPIDGRGVVGSTLTATLTLVDAPPATGLPSIGSLVANPASVTSTESVTLVAQGVSGGATSVRNVTFYSDDNRNGQLDLFTDGELGVDLTPADGWRQTLTADRLITAGGRVFARVKNVLGQFSRTATATVSIDGVSTSSAPTVDLAPPPDNHQTVDTTPTFRWSATDPDGDIVDFLLTLNDATGTAVHAITILDPARTSYTLSPAEALALGDYTWNVRATDGQGNATDSAVRRLTIFDGSINRPPTIDLVFPLHGAQIATTTPQFVWSATDPDGDPLDFEINIANQSGAVIRSISLSKPVLQQYTLSATEALAEGTFTWSMNAADGQGHVVATPQRSFTVLPPDPPNQPPVVGSLFADPTSLTNGQTVRLIASGVTDADGFVTAVTFYLDADGDGQLNDLADTMLGQDIAGADGWSGLFTLTNLIEGDHVLFARATDNDGDTGAPASVTITIVPDSVNGPPVLTLLQPDDGAAVNTPTPTFTWTAADPDDDPLDFELSVLDDAGNLLHSSLVSTPDPMQVTLSAADNLAPGDYQWHVQVSDGQGHTVQSPTRTFSVFAADAFEPNDTPQTATPITTDGATQTHSIHNGGADVDWFTFTLGATSDLDILATGQAAAPLRVSLYGPDDAAILITTVDANADTARVILIGALAPGPGTYYFRVEQVSGDTEIPSYTIAVSATDVVANNGPPILTLLLPDDGAAVTTTTPTFTWTAAATDDDAEQGPATAVTATILPPAVAADAFEPDDSDQTATPITTDGAVASHSIHNDGADIDWSRFTLLEAADVDVVVTVADAAALGVWLYGPDDASATIESTISAVPTTLLQISRSADEALGPGIYYVRVEQVTRDTEIEQYDLEVTATPVPPPPLEVIFGDGAPKTVTYTDPDGTTATLKLKSGTATAQFTGDNLVLLSTRRGARVNGSNVRLDEVSISPSRSTSTLTFSGRGGNGSVQVGRIIANALMKKISAPVANLVDQVLFPQGLGELVMNHLLPGSLVEAGASFNPRAAFSIKVKQATGASVTSGVGVKLIQAGSWTDGAGITGTIAAPWLGGVKTSGDLITGLGLTGQQSPRYALRNVKVGGAIGGGSWVVGGDVKSLNTASTSDAWSADIAGDVKSIKVGGDLRGILTARTIRTLSVAGDVVDAQIALTQAATTSRSKALGKLSVRGVLERVLITTPGRIGSIAAAAMRYVDLQAGVGVGVLGLPDSADDFVNVLASIDRLSLRARGRNAGPTFIGSRIMAAELGRIDLGRVATDNAGTVFGIASHQLKSYSRDSEDGPMRLNNVESPGLFDQEVDFELRII